MEVLLLLVLLVAGVSIFINSNRNHQECRTNIKPQNRSPNNLGRFGDKQLSRLQKFSQPSTRESRKERKARRRRLVDQRLNQPEQPSQPKGKLKTYSPKKEMPEPPEIKKGPRGGRYTEALTKEGRPYRRYF